MVQTSGFCRFESASFTESDRRTLRLFSGVDRGKSGATLCFGHVSEEIGFRVLFLRRGREKVYNIRVKTGRNLERYGEGFHNQSQDRKKPGEVWLIYAKSWLGRKVPEEQDEGIHLQGQAPEE